MADKTRSFWNVWSVFPNGNAIEVDSGKTEAEAKDDAERRSRTLGVSGSYVALPDGTTPADETAENTVGKEG